MRLRLVYLTQPPSGTRSEMNTAGRAMSLLARRAPLQVEEFDTFFRSHDHFYVYGRRSWLQPTLRARGATLRVLETNDNESLYAVDVVR